MKHRLPLLALFLSAFIAATSRAQEDDPALLRRVADTVLTQTTRRLIDRSTAQSFTDSTKLAPKPEISIESKFNAWFYQTWLLTDGMRRAASALGDPAYRDYGERNLDFIYTHLDYFQRQHAAGMKAAPVGDGALSPIGFYFRLTDLWHTGLAPLVVERYALAKDSRYEPYLARMAEFLEKSPRLPDGTLHRARGRLMADDPYMTVPYLVRMHRLTGEVRYLDDAAQQLLGTSRMLFNQSQGWYRHAWDVKAQAPLGEHWGRANGWMMLTEVELLATLPVSHPARARVLTLFAAHAEGLRRAQDPAGGWHQLLDHPESWIESSSTGMFVYGLARGVNEGWLDGALAETARKGWSALKQKVTADGDIVDVCGSTDVGGVSYYLARPRLQGDLHGFGPFLLSAGEILRLKR